MCTLVIYRDPKNAYPVMIGQVRDEIVHRKWLVPDRHWIDNESVIAGIDLVKRGSWLGINRSGVFCAILNGRGTCTEIYGSGISRGQIVIDVLAYNTIKSIKDFLYNNIKILSVHKDFILVIASNTDAFCCINKANEISFQDIPFGTSIITNYGLNNNECYKTNKFMSKFQDIMPQVDPELNRWDRIIDILKVKGTPDNIDAGITVELNERHFGTVSSSLVALHTDTTKNVFKFCSGYPHEHGYVNIDLIR